MPKPSDELPQPQSDGPTTPPGAILRVAEDCAGISAFSLDLRRLGVLHEHVLVSEKEPARRAFLRANYGISCPIDEDLRARDFASVQARLRGHVDLYVAGFPCKDASRLIKERRGLAGKHTGLFFHCLRTLEALLPKVAILENVTGLKDRRNGAQNSEWDTVRSKLQAFAEAHDYTFRHATLNVRDFGLPQNRDRLFMLLIRNDCAARPFVWPHRLPSPLAEVLLDGGPFPPCELEHKFAVAPMARRSIRLAYQLLEARGGNHPFDELYLLTIQNGFGTGKLPMQGTVPCLTEKNNIWLTTYGRYIIIQECCRAQGFQLHEMQGLADCAADGMSENQLSLALGNSIGANVAELLLREVLPAAGLSGDLPDRWRDGARLQQILAGKPLDAAAAAQYFPSSRQFDSSGPGTEGTTADV